MPGTAQRFLQLLSERAHFIGGCAGVRAEPQLTARTGENSSPVGDDERRRQAEEENSQVRGDFGISGRAQRRKSLPDREDHRPQGARIGGESGRIGIDPIQRERDGRDEGGVPQ